MSFNKVKKLRSLTLYLLLTIMLASGTQGMSLAAPATAVAGPGNSGANYAEALQKTILFYEAQRSVHFQHPHAPHVARGRPTHRWVGARR
jgi:hypothetical protein